MNLTDFAQCDQYPNNFFYFIDAAKAFNEVE